jgi:hypothetical protein
MQEHHNSAISVTIFLLPRVTITEGQLYNVSCVLKDKHVTGPIWWELLGCDLQVGCMCSFQELQASLSMLAIIQQQTMKP